MNESCNIYNEALQTLMNISTIRGLFFSHLPPPVMLSHCKFCFSVVAKHIRSLSIVTTNFLCPRDWWIKTLSLKEKDYKTMQVILVTKFLTFQICFWFPEYDKLNWISGMITKLHNIAYVTFSMSIVNELFSRGTKLIRTWKFLDIL